MNLTQLARPFFRTFLIVFCTANGYILLSGSTCLWLASQERLSPEQTRMFETCNATWQKGTDTIFQLLDHVSLKHLPTNSQPNQ